MPQADTAHLKIVMDLGGNASTGIAKLNKQVSGLGRSLGRTGKGVGQIGAGFAKAGLVVGGAAVAGIAAAVKTAADFEDAFAGVRKTLQASDSELDAIADQFRTLATQIPIPATELARIGETAGALGIAKGDIVGFTKVIAELGETTNLTTDQAAEDVGKVSTILNLHGGQIEKFADTLVNLGNQGASTESDIVDTTKRFAAMGKQAGLTTNQILALASASTSLGAEPEAAGSALTRIFGSMSTNIALANKKGKAFAQVTGKSVTQLQKMINRGDGLPILLDTLKGISKMSKTEAASTLKALGITNVRDVNTILTMAQNLGFVNDQLAIADKSGGALGKEFAKRMNTTTAKVTLLKQNLQDLGMTLGVEVLPSVRRAIDKIIKALQLPGTKSDVKKLGQDIGKAIDNIDWDDILKNGREFVSVLKDGLGFAKNIFDVINALPTQVKAAGAALLVLNKASGGLIGSGVGNVVGGLAESIIRGLGSKLPGGAGRLFAQPVFVTNWPVGGLGGGGGVGGGGGKGGLSALSKLFLVGETIGLVLAVNDVRQAVQDSATQQAQEVAGTLTSFLANPDLDRAALQNALDGVNQGIKDLKADPLAVALVSGPALAELEKMRGVLEARLTGPVNGAGKPHPGVSPPAPGGATPVGTHDAAWQKLRATQLETRRETTRGLTATRTAIDNSKEKLAAQLAETKRETTRGVTATNAAKSAINTTKNAVTTGDNHVAATVSTGSAAIVGAIWAARPTINVTNVTKTTTIQNRYAPGNGSQGQPAHDLG